MGYCQVYLVVKGKNRSKGIKQITHAGADVILCMGVFVPIDLQVSSAVNSPIEADWENLDAQQLQISQNVYGIFICLP